LQHDLRDRFTSKAARAERRGLIFVDYLRNERGATAIASYSSRAREGATVATPIRWSELTASLDPRKFTVQSIPGRLARLREDPWKGYLTSSQQLKRAALRAFER
jgi:bifunctional non-homologous end joining protein LigD